MSEQETKDKALERLKKRYAAGASGDIMSINIKDGEVSHRVELVKVDNEWKVVKIVSNSPERFSI